MVPKAGNPQSLNRFSYVLNRPLRHTDPSGHCPPFLLPFCIAAGAVLAVDAYVYYGPHTEGALFGTGPDYRGLKTVQGYEEYIGKTEGVPPIMVAAGMAVQSQWSGFPQDNLEELVESKGGTEKADPSLGPAQITQAELDAFGIKGSALDPGVAVQAMTQKIQRSVSACTGCSVTDQFIVAGMAQNGFSPGDVANALGVYGKGDGTIDWSGYFANPNRSSPSGSLKQTWLGFRSGGRNWSLFQLQLFINDLQELKKQGWDLPEGVNLDYMQCVAGGANDCKR